MALTPYTKAKNLRTGYSQVDSDATGPILAPVVTVQGGGTPAALGQATKANSVPVVLASDDDIQAKLGIVTETAPASDTASSGLNGRLQRIAQNLTTFFGAKVTAITALAAGGSGVIGWLSQIWNELQGRLPAALGQGTSAQSLKVVIASDQSALAVTPGNTTLQVAVDGTRPVNTTPYNALDNVIGAVEFLAFGSAGVAYLIQTISMRLDISAVPSGMSSFRLHLYNVTPPSAPVDNAAFDLPSGDRASYLGYIDIPAPTDLGSTCFAQDLNVGKIITLSGTSVFGVLQTIGAYTPAANSEVYRISMGRIVV